MGLFSNFHQKRKFLKVQKAIFFVLIPKKGKTEELIGFSPINLKAAVPRCLLIDYKV